MYSIPLSTIGITAEAFLEESGYTKQTAESHLRTHTIIFPNPSKSTHLTRSRWMQSTPSTLIL